MLRTFDTDEDLYKKFKEICMREGTHVGEKINEFLKDYVKVHGSGNPAYTLDQFKDPGFKAVPAFLSRMETWGSYLEKCKLDEIEEIRSRAVSIKMHIDKRFPG